MPSRFVVLVLLALSAACAPSADGSSFVITNALIMDGTGAPPRPGSVRVRGDTIAEVGEVALLRGEPRVDARGMVLAPGFIDTHTHMTEDLRSDSTALAAVSQGITTIVGGQDGGSPPELAAWLAGVASRPAPVNVASYVGHGTIRRQVMGEDFKRVATPAEVEAMQVLLAKGLEAGALGLSSGLEYDPGIYSSRDELMALAKVTAAAGGRYISHIRSEDFAFWPAIEEIIAIGREAKLPVQVSHTKLAMKGLWGQADSLVRRLDAARASGVDITADVYPYVYWQSTLTVLFPKRNFRDRRAATFALSQTTTPQGLRLVQYRPHPGWAGKTLAEIAAERGVDSATALIDLVAEALAMEDSVTRESATGGAQVGSGEVEPVESIIATSMSEEDLAAILRWPHANFCSDGSLAGAHPRGFGSFPRILGQYVRERGVLSLAEAVRKATGLAAAHMGFRGRGTIAPGMKADLVLFDPAAIRDRATPADPHAVSDGVLRTWVNGVVVYADGRATGARAGQVIRR